MLAQVLRVDDVMELVGFFQDSSCHQRVLNIYCVLNTLGALEASSDKSEMTSV